MKIHKSLKVLLLILNIHAAGNVQEQNQDLERLAKEVWPTIKQRLWSLKLNIFYFHNKSCWELSQNARYNRQYLMQNTLRPRISAPGDDTSTSIRITKWYLREKKKERVSSCYIVKTKIDLCRKSWEIRFISALSRLMNLNNTEISSDCEYVA